MGKSLLFLVGGLTLIAGLIQVWNNKRMQALPETTSSYYEEQQSRNIAKSLVDNAIRNIVINNTWRDDISLEEVMDIGSMVNRSSTELKAKVKSLDAGETPVQQQNRSDGNSIEIISGQLYSYIMNDTDIPPNSVENWDEYTLLLISSGTYGNTKVTIEVLMQRDSFSKYAYFSEQETNSEDRTRWWITDDVIYGPIHTNGTFHIYGAPSFHGLVSSPNTPYVQAEYGDNRPPNFYGGTNFNAEYKQSPPQSELDKLVAKADPNSNGLSFRTDINIRYEVINNKGFVYINKTNTNDMTIHDMQSFNGIISTTGEATVEGVVKGQSTLHAKGDVKITGDITYKTNPLDDESSTDQLGIVSENNIIVDREAHKFQGDSDLNVQASLMTLNGSFKVEGWDEGPPKGSLNMLGGIFQKYRGSVSKSDNRDVIIHGYDKNYRYDPRLRTSSPPAFPRESQFSIKHWTEKIERLEDS